MTDDSEQQLTIHYIKETKEVKDEPLECGCSDANRVRRGGVVLCLSCDDVD